jgi:hypothetical protein
MLTFTSWPSAPRPQTCSESGPLLDAGVVFSGFIGAVPGPMAVLPGSMGV